MNKVTPVSDSASSLEESSKKGRKSKPRIRLPTPPPDPTTPEPETSSKQQHHHDVEFLEYLDSLQKPTQRLSRSASTFATALATEDAFDHLDKLYKLMGHMLTLREQNVLLHRRIKDLERLRSVQDMRKPRDPEAIPVELDPDSFYAENVLFNILNKKDSKKSRFPLLRKKGSIYDDAFDCRRVSLAPSTFSDKAAKVSKWTKVKAAFKWEKASPNVSDSKSQDSGLGLIQPINYEVARYLRVPSTSEEVGTSPADSGAAEISTPATLSSASSVDDIHHRGGRRTQEDTSDDDPVFSYDIPSAKDAQSKSGGTKRTPWAKVKDIIQTRQSFKKSHRLSAKSDDSKVDEVIGSEDEEVFEEEEDDDEKPMLVVQSPEEISKALSLEHNIPVDVIAKYRIVDDENRQDSKWNKVKEAFLTNQSMPVTPTPSTNNEIQEEIQKNYERLQKKLSLEFQEKANEWQRNRMNSPTSSSAATGSSLSTSHEDSKEMAFKKKMEEWEKIRGQPKHNMQLQSEQNLPPEFRKKLQEWKKIKKGSVKGQDKRKLSEAPKWKSLGGTKTDLETKPLSREFLKKYESWKVIKAGHAEDSGDGKVSRKTPSPKINRKDSECKKIKGQIDKEMQWFEKELGKIEREKLRVERDRQKFLDREERLSKIRRSLGGPGKKEILVQTPSGFYRFEGISRKFTQKLYEWEKARGIRPEESTFALLKSSCIPNVQDNENFSQGVLTRSKSADSVMNVDINPLLSHQPSSLSLNELEKLEKDIIIGETIPDIIPSTEEAEDDEEPEALIVEVEDVVEETASLLDDKYTEKHFPIYHKQDDEKLCSSETNLAPKVRRSESVHAQANYNLIEEILDLSSKLLSNENDIIHAENGIFAAEETNSVNKENDELTILKNKEDIQKELSDLLIGKLIKLQDANSHIAMNATKEESKLNISRLVDVLDTIQDLTSELFNLAETIDNFIYKRNKVQLESLTVIGSKQNYPQIIENLLVINKKLLELRKNLSYIYAVSDMSVSNWKQELPKLQRNISLERRRNIFWKTRSREEAEDESKQIEQGAIKKRQRFRQKSNKTLEESDDDNDNDILLEQRKQKPRRVKSQNSTESNKSKQDELKPKEEANKEIMVDAELVEKILVPTKSMSFEEKPSVSPVSESSVTVFVKTTKKLFSAITDPSTTKDDLKGESSAYDQNPESNIETAENSDRLPPLPSVTTSPISQRKVQKEISPNIRLMMVRYNQKLTEESGIVKSTGSSGSVSPVAWRSPVLERRVKAQTEKYQQEIEQKMSPLLGGRREVQKSASTSVVISGNKQVTVHGAKISKNTKTKGILKSSSVGVIKCVEPIPLKKSDFQPIFETEATKQSTSLSTLCDARSIRLQKAKEAFFNIPSTSKTTNFETERVTNTNEPILRKNRLSQISMGSESSCSSSNYGILIKSASAGMINIDPDSYKQFDPEIHVNGCVSLPRASKKNIFSNITSKFRKVKMRRHKEQKTGSDKMNTVSTLCRQSLVVDISNSSQETLSEGQQSRLSLPSDSRGSSTDTSPSQSRTSSWIKKRKLFTKK